LRKIIPVAAALLAALPPHALAQGTASPPTIAHESTPAVGAMHLLVSAINGYIDRGHYVTDAFSSAALKNESAETRLKWLDKLAADTGGMTVVSAAPQGERMVEAIVHTKRGSKFGKLVVVTSKNERGKINDLFLLPARDPAKVKAEAWPKGPLSLPRIAAEIGKRGAALATEDNFSGVVLVAKGDKVLVRRAYGLADQEWHIPNRPDTRFHLGSVGKMFTAAAILKLANEGKLGLDDPLSKWVPDYRHPEASRITLRQLLTHTSGIGDWDVRQAKTPLSGGEMAALMTEAPQSKPGERFGYSNAGYVLLQAVIEKAAGKPFATALDALIIRPAGMTHTGLWPVTAIVPNRATGYLHSEDDPLGLGPRFSNEQFLGFQGNGAGGEYSTADDMFRFLSAIANGKLIGAKATKEMLAPRINFAGAPRPSKYGYGIDLTACAGHPVFGHEGGGANSGVSSLAYRTLDSGWTIVVLSNYDPPAAGDLAFSICEFVAGR
jgi:CubicO group peptidase (beta-lactamase class C family)